MFLFLALRLQLRLRLRTCRAVVLRATAKGFHMRRFFVPLSGSNIPPRAKAPRTHMATHTATHTVPALQKVSLNNNQRLNDL